MKKVIHKNELTRLFKESAGIKEYLESYSAYITRLLSGLDYAVIEKITACFLRARSRKATIFFIGNGGSAATASHFAQDLGEVGRKADTASFRTICLNESVSFMTALANDYGYEEVFAGQLGNLFKRQDVLVAISASGNSPNVVEAVKLAKKLKGITIGLVGFDGGKLASLCDYVLKVTTNKGEYGPVEDIHLILDHIITTYLTMKDLARSKKNI